MGLFINNNGGVFIYMEKILDWYFCLNCYFKFSWESLYSAEQCPKCRSEQLRYKGKGITYPNMRNENEQ